MRKVKAIEILAAAAVAAVPFSAFANEDAVPGRPGVRDRAPQSNVLGAQDAFGRFTLNPVAALGSGPEADGSFTWIGFSGGTWQVPTNWTPTGVPDGANAHAFITNLNNGGLIVLNGNITLNTLNFSDPQIAFLGGPTTGAPQTITMTGAAAINHQFFPSQLFPVTPRYFGTAIGLPAIAPNPSRPIVLAGNSGLNYTGGATAIRSNNTYTGNTTINANTYVTVMPGASLDGAFGSSGNIVLNGGEIWVEIDNAVNTRNIVVNPAGGTLSLGTDPASIAITTHTFNGTISGSGPLRIDNTFGGNGVFTANNTTSGAVRFSGFGTNVLSGGGGFASASSITNGGTLILGGAGANRLPDAGALRLHGGALRIENFAGAYTETVGSTHLLTATPAIIVRPGGGSVYNGGVLTRGAGTGLEVRGQNLGSAPGGNVTNVNFSNAAGFVVGGVIPWAYGHADDAFFFGIENDATEFLTAGPNGLIPRSQAGGYLENTFAGSTSATNVRLRAGALGQPGDNPVYNIAGNVNMNSLVLAPGFDGFGNGVGGIFINGNGTLHIASGGVLSASSGYVGTSINSGVGNTFNVNINFGTAEGVMNSPGAITMNGNIFGSGGLTKTGVRTLFMNGTGSTYTGTTTLTGFNRHMGNLLLGQPSAYGSDTSDIVLVPFDRLQDDPGIGPTGIPFVSFGPDAGQGATTMTRGLRVMAGGNDGLISVLLRNFSSGTFTMAGPITLDANTDLLFQSLGQLSDAYVASGNISGAGHAGTAPTVGNVFVVLSGNNTFSGGFDHNGGDLTANTNTAFGTGLITVTGGDVPAVLRSTTGPRTIANPMLLSGNRLQVHNPFTFTGPVALGGTLLDVIGGNTVTFSGVLSEQDLFKEGAGTAVLSGANTFDGVLSVGNIVQGQPVNGGWVVLANNTAAGSPVGQTQIIGASALGMTGSINVPAEPLLMTSATNGPDGQGALRSLAGNNTWGGNVLLVDINAAPGGPTSGSAGAKPGATLSSGQSVFVSGDANSTFTFTKFGPGVVNVGHNQFTATRSSGATSTFQGSIVGVNTLAINEGRLAMTPAGPEGPHVSDVGSITFSGSAQFDLNNNALVVDYPAGGPSPLADIRSRIVSGYAGGAWNGPGIMSSMADNNNFGVGYAEASDVLTFSGSPPDALFLGNVVDQSSVLARFTRYGDANLDGVVNLADFNRLAANFGASGAVWSQGDFNYDGLVNLADFNRLAANFGLMAGPDGPTPDDWSNLASAIPEPSILGLAGLAGVGLLRRRRLNSR